VTTNEQEPIS